MYEDIGGKMKGLASTVMIVESIAAVITGIAMIVVDEYLILFGLLTIVLGPAVAWISSWLLYGFGEIIDYLGIIAENSSRQTKHPEGGSIIKPGSKPLSQTPVKSSNPAAAAGEWVCTCGKVHKDFESSCVCGVTKREAKLAQKQ